jgi:hypothetical protein
MAEWRLPLIIKLGEQENTKGGVWGKHTKPKN